MEALNRKLDRAVEAAKIKPDARLKTMQNNEKLVAVNERIDEAMNYRKELKEFEIKEGERVAALKQKNEENQRKTLIKNQVSLNQVSNNPYLPLWFYFMLEKRNGSVGGQNRNCSPQSENLDG